jgi:hypothetical protein
MPPAHVRRLVLASIAAATLASAPVAQGAPVFPLHVDATHRYLVDSSDAPFLMVGDAPQALIGNLSEHQADVFMANRQKFGINALWINLLCDSYTACNADGTTFDGIAPFATAGDLSTPNPAYFDRAADMIALAAKCHMVVLLDPAETGGWLGTLESNGVEKARAYGKFLGKRFRDMPNIIWLSGNDFQNWSDPAADAVVSALAEGIRSTESHRIQTIELNYYVSDSLDDPTWRDIAGIDAVYTYRPTYAQELKAYRRKSFMPTFLVEANYEFEQNGGTDGGSTPNLRHQEYWTMLSGTTGQLYASHWTWTLQGDWRHNLDTPGAQQLKYMKQAFDRRRWYDLVPDFDGKVLVGGRGHFSATDSIDTDTYATAACTPDGKLFMAYMPNARTFTIDMSKLSGSVTAQWYDPTNGTYHDAGSNLRNSGKRKFAPPGMNNTNDGDWLLVLTAH